MSKIKIIIAKNKFKRDQNATYMKIIAKKFKKKLI